MIWPRYALMALVGVVIMIAFRWSEYYAAAPISGQVVDAQTNEPIPGVNIVLQWAVSSGSHDHREGLLEVKEAVTDAHGLYAIEGWGPLRNPFSGALRAYQPEMIVFHPAYYPRLLSNIDPNLDPSLGWAPEFVAMPFYWNGKTITLEKATNKQQFSSLVSTMSTEARLLYFPIDCAWTKAALFLRKVDEIRERAVAEGYNIMQFPTLDNVRRNEQCGNVSAILGEKK